MMSFVFLVLPRLLGAFRRREWLASDRNPRGCPAVVKVRVRVSLDFAMPFDNGLGGVRSFDIAVTLVGLLLSWPRDDS